MTFLTMFHDVVAAAERAQIVQRGAATVGPGDRVVEVAGDGGHGAAGVDAAGVAVADKPGECRGRDAAVSQVQDGAGPGVGQDSSPVGVRGQYPADVRGDRAVADQLGGVVVESGESADGGR